MTSTQKTIKYVAMGLAIALAIFIVGSIVSAILYFTSAFGEGPDVSLTSSTMAFDGDIRSIYVESISDVEIREGDGYKVEGINVPDSFIAEKNGESTLRVTMNTDVNEFFHNIFRNSVVKKGKIIVTVPEQTSLEAIEICNSIGDVVIQDIKVNDLKLETGTGDVKIVDIDIMEGTIHSGVGDLKVEDSIIRDAYLESGVGDIYMNGILEGKLEFNSGVGDVDLELQGNREDYDFEFATGVGSAKIDGEKVSNEYESNNHAKHTISVDAGVGDLDVIFR